MTEVERQIAFLGPIKVELEPGKDYYFCACGRSQNQPFCDGSHKGTQFVPLKVNVEEKKDYYLCRCKESENLPFCDGTHNKEPTIKKYNKQLLQANTALKEKVLVLETAQYIQSLKGKIEAEKFAGLLEKALAGDAALVAHYQGTKKDEAAFLLGIVSL